jgi:hypothetical protein
MLHSPARACAGGCPGPDAIIFGEPAGEGFLLISVLANDDQNILLHPAVVSFIDLRRHRWKTVMGPNKAFCGFDHAWVALLVKHRPARPAGVRIGKAMKGIWGEEGEAVPPCKASN